MSVDQFVSALNHVRDDMTEEAMQDYVNTVIGLCLKYEGQPEKLGREILRLTLSATGQED